MKTYVLLSTAAFLVVGVLFLNTRQSLLSSRRDLAEAQQRIAALEGKIAEVPVRTVQVNSSAADKSELMRLRAEVTALRQETSTLNQLAAIRASEKKEQQEKPTLLAGDLMLKYLTRTNSFVSRHDQEAIAALNQKHQELLEWWKALQQYAEANEGWLPTELAAAQKFLPTGFTNTMDLSNFVRPYPDARPVHLPSLENRSMTVLFKEREPAVMSDGTVCNAWLFADGKVITFK